MSRLNVANFRHPDGTADNINLDSSGRVGIGTTSPSQLLTISSASDTNYLMTTTNSTAHNRINFTNTGSSASGGLWYGSSNTMEFRTSDTEQMRLTSTGDLRFNSGYGSVATAYGVRAWVQFQGSNGTINADGNVSSVTRNSTGNYTVNFATAMPDDDYAAVCSSKGSWNLLATHIVTTSSVNVLAVNQSFAYSDHTFISLVIVR